MMRLTLFCCFIVAGLLAFNTGCGAAPEEPAAKTLSRDVTRGDFGDNWPLTVDGGTLTCSGGAVMINIPGRGLFGLNEKAMGPDTGTKSIEELRTPLYEEDGTPKQEKMSLQPLIDAGLDLCQERI